MDYVKYLDKSPLAGYSLGPSGSGILQTQPFNTEWIGWYDPTAGVYVQATSGGPVSFYPQTAYPNTESFSFTFDSGNNLWYCLGEAGVLRTFQHSGSSVIQYSFSGEYGQLYNNSVLARNRNDTVCFYKKNKSIYVKSSNEAFTTEHLVYSGNPQLYSLKQIYKKEYPTLYRINIYGQDENGDGFALTTDKENTITQEFFQPFDQWATGQVYNTILWDIEEPSVVFVEGLFFFSENFEDFPLGPIPGNLGSNTFASGALFYSDDFEVTPTGSVIYLSGDNNMFGGYFING
jgi:hypothetical protein